MNESLFRQLISLVLKQGSFITEMRKSLSNVVERTKEGSLDQQTFSVEKVTDTEIIDVPKGSQRLLDMTRTCE